MEAVWELSDAKRLSDSHRFRAYHEVFMQYNMSLVTWNRAVT